MKNILFTRNFIAFRKWKHFGHASHGTGIDWRHGWNSQKFIFGFIYERGWSTLTIGLGYCITFRLVACHNEVFK